MAKCEYGHENPDASAFCSTCGMAMRAYAIPKAPADGAPSHPAEESQVPQDKKPAGATGLLGKHKVVAAGAAILLVVVVAAVALSGAGGEKRTIEGTFALLSADDVTGDMSDCEGTGGYSDVDEGVPVTIRDQQDNIVGSGTLQNASVDEVARRFADREDGGDSLPEAQELVEQMDGVFCVLVFDAEVDEADFYDIEVGTRGKISYSRKELEENSWTAAFTLGD